MLSGIALDGVGDVLLRDAVAFGQPLEHLTQLGLGFAHVGVQLLEPLPRILPVLQPGPQSRQLELRSHHATRLRPPPGLLRFAALGLAVGARGAAVPRRREAGTLAIGCRAMAKVIRINAVSVGPF